MNALIRYRADIDGLRAVAVLSVVLYHLDVALFSGGFVGVDVFFVISGFLITRLIRDEMREGVFSFKRFYLRRARRLMPALFFTLFLTTIAAGIILAPKDLMGYGTAVLASIFSVANILLWQEAGYFDAASDLKPLLHMWSLSVEEQFYFFWPACLLFLMRKAPHRGPYIACIVAALVSLALAIAWLKIDGLAAFYLIPFRVYEFMIGAAMAWIIAHQPKRPWMLEPLLLLGLGMIGYAVFTYTRETPFPSYWALIPCIGTALVIYAGHAKWGRHLLDNDAMVGIGLVSYSFYLVHWPAIVFFKYLSNGPLTPFFQALIFFLTLGLAVLMYFYIEKPFRRSSTHPKHHPTPRFLQDCLIAALVIIVPVLTMLGTSGWQWRIEKQYREMVKDPTNFHLSHYGGVNYPSDTVIKFGDLNASPSMIMFGDSFGMHYIHGINQLFKLHGQSVIATFYQGCFMAPNMSTYEDGVYKTKCDGDYEQAKKLMAGNNLPVIIAHSWHTYNGWLGNANGSFKFPDLYSYYNYMLSQIDSIIRDIGPDRQIVIFGVPPGEEQDRPIATCFTMPSYLSGGCADQLTVPMKKANGFIFTQLLGNFLKKYPNVTFINPYKAFCDEQVCRVMDGKKILYSDGAHLSIDGSDLFAKHFANELLGFTSVGAQQRKAGVVLEQPKQQP